MMLSSGSTNKSTEREWISWMNWTELSGLLSLIHFHRLKIERDIRRCLFARFPYSLIYGVEEQTIVVIAVAHSHRVPDYWMDRLSFD